MAYYNVHNWKPQKRIAGVLNRAMEHINSVPYRVSERWVFYRLLQEGYYRKKKDIKALNGITSRARHSYWNGWRPDTLEDDTRWVVNDDVGFETKQEARKALREDGIRIPLSHWPGQKYYVECWFEARAMTDQFRYYAKGCTLRPFGGQPSIPFKWEAAKGIEKAAQKYGKPVVVLYFGDCDKAGGTIADVGERDVRSWCNTDFDFIRCGLTAEQAERYRLPENPEKPGEYQWEALTNQDAKDIIEENVFMFVDAATVDKATKRQGSLEREVRDVLARGLK